MQILNRYLSQFRAPIQSLRVLTPRRLPSTPPLVGVFTANSRTEKVKDPLKLYRSKECLESREILRSYQAGSS